MPLAPGEFTPNDFIMGGVAGLGVIAGTAAMSYYATSDDDYRVKGLFADASETGEVGLFGDLRVQVLVASFVGTPFLAAQGLFALATATGVLGTSALFSLVGSEAQRWAETGEYFGISLPALPAMDEAPAAIAAPVAPPIVASPVAPTAAESISGIHYGRMHR